LSNNHLLDADAVKKAKDDEVYTKIIVHVIVAFRTFPIVKRRISQC